MSRTPAGARRVAATLALLGALAAPSSATGEGKPAAPARPAILRAAAAEQAREDYLEDSTRLVALLGAFSAASVVAGAALTTRPESFARAFGVQALVWGTVDGAIAYHGFREARAARTLRLSASGWAARRAALRRALAANAALDVAYVAAGAALFAVGSSDEARGAGAGVMAQGSFLLAFDLGGFLYLGR